MTRCADASTLSAVFGDAEWTVRDWTTRSPPSKCELTLSLPEFFDVLGVPALYGRALTAGDARENPGPPPVVLSYGFWQRRFAGDVQAVGRTITLRSHKFVVVGVMPRPSMESRPIPRRTCAFHCDVLHCCVSITGVPLPIALRPRIGCAAQAGGYAGAGARGCFAIWRAATEVGMRRAHAKQDDIDTVLSRGLESRALERGVSLFATVWSCSSIALRFGRPASAADVFQRCRPAAGAQRRAARRDRHTPRARRYTGAPDTPDVHRSVFLPCARPAAGWSPPHP